MPALPCSPRSTPSARCSPSPVSLARWWPPRRPGRQLHLVAPNDVLARRRRRRTARRAVDSITSSSTTRSCSRVLMTAPARGRPGAVFLPSPPRSSFTSHLLPLSCSRSPGPFLVTTAAVRRRRRSVQMVDRAPGFLLSLFVLLFVLCTWGADRHGLQGRVGGCRGFLHAKGDSGGVIGGHGVAGVRTPAAPCTSQFAATGSGGPVAAGCPLEGGRR